MDKEYRQKVRSLSYNLSDASNPGLRARVLQEEVTPDQLVQMTPNQLASKVSQSQAMQAGNLPSQQPSKARQSIGKLLLICSPF